MKWCRLNAENVVIETTELDPKGRFAKSVVWNRCPDDVQDGWVLSTGGTYSAPPAPAMTAKDFAGVIQAHLDATAQERQYDGIQTAVSYRGDPNTQFAAEAEAIFAWRSAVWTAALAILAEVEAGTRPIPTADALIAELPEIIWPE